MSLARANRTARPVAYGADNTVQASYASRTMVMSGLIVLAFIIYHLMHFTFKVAHPEIAQAAGDENVYGMVVGSFKVPAIAFSYIFAMLVLCAHLSHGVSSLFQSLGFNNRKWDRRFKLFARLIAFVIFAGNTSIPLAALLGVLK
jgi:succinate dehydrogenase / fumarate reductase cytochrome b subunit